MYQFRDRWIQLRECIPQLFDPANAPLDILYIGAHHKHVDGVRELLKVGHNPSLLELVPNFAKRFREGGMSAGLFDKVYTGDVRKIGSMDLPSFNVVFWWHGPEHLYRHEVEPTIELVEQIARHLVVIACPWGKTKLDRDDEEGVKLPGQVHLSQLYPGDFEVIGYQTATIGFEDGRAGSPSHATNLLAWKWLGR